MKPTLAQALTGRGRFAQYLNRFKWKSSPCCPCDPEGNAIGCKTYCTFVQIGTRTSRGIGIEGWTCAKSRKGLESESKSGPGLKLKTGLKNSLRPTSARAALTALACRCLYLGVGGCGAAASAARGWWGAAPARLHRLLQRLVSAYVTPALVRAQLSEVATRGGRLADTELVIHLSTRELECRCSVDERPVRLRLELSDHHPLGAPRVDAEGAPDPNLLSLAVPLAAQNGSVWRALRLWRARLVRHVESAPVCYVCYMRLHPDSGRLPRQRCSQCRNKFHHECLQKWFTTSKKMECPLCRAVYKS
ncbi:E3 ubiquitin-protein ligase listerin [Eumeta japonica]|uniref:E3 ubiquitin-protein ligase listerin n=1 Tax=Eumeta variegata TaxID=151549 RepID=A0A4C2A486_EUMVA|nr:E3 ubiquitin-protein ligase listerin [Eumeta japonica]